MVHAFILKEALIQRVGDLRTVCVFMSQEVLSM